MDGPAPQSGVISRVLPLLLALVAPATLAHHSISAHFDLEARTVVEGVVTEFSFRNPHSLVYVEVPVDAGTTETWVLQWQNTAVMTRRGYGRDTVQPGDRVIAGGNPARDGSNWLRLLRLQRPADGFEYQASMEEEYLLIPRP